MCQFLGLSRKAGDSAGQPRDDLSIAAVFWREGSASDLHETTAATAGRQSVR